MGLGAAGSLIPASDDLALRSEIDPPLVQLAPLAVLEYDAIGTGSQAPKARRARVHKRGFRATAAALSARRGKASGGKAVIIS